MAAEKIKQRTIPRGTRLFLKIAAIIMLGILLSQTAFRVDLTSDKRYSLSPITKSTLQGLKENLYIDVYLNGELNIPFKKFRRSVDEMLREFKAYGGQRFRYRFIDPLAIKGKKEADELLEYLYEMGLTPTNIISDDKKGGKTEKIVFPGAVVRYRDAAVVVNLLKNNPLLTAEENLTNSIQAIEYELISKIRSITSDSVTKIAFIEGYGEPQELYTADITRELSNYFQIDRGVINGKQGILDSYKAIILARPTRPIPEADKFIIDQYIMRGGSVLWLIDPVSASLDSMVGNNIIVLPWELNIDDMLFRYGVRINNDLIQDMQCNQIPVNTAFSGQPPSFVPFPWPYHILITPPATHPLTRNLNLIEARFASSIDTIGARTGIAKAVLLKTSPNAQKVNAPLFISFEETIRKLPVFTPQQDGYAIAVLLEGEFESVFRNRIVDAYFPEGAHNFVPLGRHARMIVIADGNMILNDANPKAKGISITPLGFDRLTRQTFGNRDFMLNALHYLTDQDGLILLRSRELRLRLLDKSRVTDKRLQWQLLNIACPILLVLLTAILFHRLRKKKFARAR